MGTTHIAQFNVFIVNKGISSYCKCNFEWENKCFYIYKKICICKYIFNENIYSFKYMYKYMCMCIYIYIKHICIFIHILVID